jgi:uncharacterized protein (DUF849 family)
MEPRKVIVTVAPTGGILTKAENPNIPTQPEEIADVVAECCELGAAIAAIHARRPDDQPTCNPDVYKMINEAVRRRCDIIVNNSTGGGFGGDMMREYAPGRWETSFDERIKGTQAGAEMCTLDAQTQFVFGKSETDVLFDTSPQKCERLARAMREEGIKPEWEVMAPDHILQEVSRLIKGGYDRPPHYVNLVFGLDRVFQGALPYTPRFLQLMIDLLPAGSIFCVSAMGAAQLPATTMSVLLGGHIRVGLEDNSYYSYGRRATNQDLVGRAVRIVGELGCEPATPAEAREMLGLKAPAAV